MTWIDSHCHLTSKDLIEQVDDVVASAEASGVDRFVSIATDIADANRLLAISNRFPSVHVVAGIHPHESGKVLPGWDHQLIELVRRPDVFGVGEMGLDYHYDFSDRDAQKRVFERQLEIAEQVAKPIVIHCREAFEDTLEILERCFSRKDVVFHCFTGTEQEAEAIFDRGYWLSFTGVVTFKRSEELREIVRKTPADRFMIETDSPYLSPEPKRSVRPNVPAHVGYIGDCVAKVREATVTDLSSLLWRNTLRFFGLPETV